MMAPFLSYCVVFFPSEFFSCSKNIECYRVLAYS